MVEAPRGPRDRKEPPGSAGQRARGGSAPETLQLVVTLDAASHGVIGFAWLENGGRRHELSAQDWAELTGDDEMDDLVAAVEEAYRAGVTDGLDEADTSDEDDDDDDDAFTLVQMLFDRPEPWTHRRGMRNARLRRLLLRQVLRRHSADGPSAAEQRRKPPIAKHARNGSSSTSHHPYQGGH